MLLCELAGEEFFMTLLPHDPDEQNAARSMWALQALDTFARETGQSISMDGLGEVMGDLLVDLAHLADRNNLNIRELLLRAAGSYLEETDSSGTQFGGLSNAGERGLSLGNSHRS